jgi:hypothetical protein
MENSMMSPQKLKIELPYDLAVYIPKNWVYPKELNAGSQRDIFMPVFIPAPFTIVKHWK